MIKGVQAVKGELSGLEKQLSDAFSHESSLQSSGLIRSEQVETRDSAKCLMKCCEIVKKVSFLNFDVKEWITDNDLLVHRLKASRWSMWVTFLIFQLVILWSAFCFYFGRETILLNVKLASSSNVENKLVEEIKSQEDDSQITVKGVVGNFKSLLEKVQGLPPASSFICYELAIVYNLSHLLLRGHTNLPVGGHHKSAFILHKSLFRAFEAFEIGNFDQESTRDATDLFSVSNVDHTLKQLLPSLFKAFSNNNIGCAPLVLSCCLVAFLWLLDEHVNRVKAVELLTFVQSHLKHLKDDARCNVTDEVSSDRCPVHLFSLEYIPSISNCIVTSSTEDLTDTQNLLALVTSMLAFSHYANEDYDKVLTTLEERVEGQDVGFNDLYLKGYVFFTRNEVDGAMSLFQQCVHISQGQNKAAALNMLGCCCAVKGKHHTAISKFREAVQNDFEQLEALFNICVQYRKLGNFTAEIQCLKLLKEAISGKVESEQCCNVAVISTDHGHDQRNRRLELTVPPRFTLTGGMPRTRITTELVTYMLAKRSAELGRFEEAANSYLELLANIVKMQSSNCSDVIHLPSPTELYRQCAVTLLSAGRYQDTLTVCDKVLTTSDNGLKPTENGRSNEQNGNSTAPRKRLRSNEDDSVTSTNEESVSCVMLVLKAEALIQLHQPLEALQALNRVLKTLEGVRSSNFYLADQGKETSEDQQRKRRRLDTGDSTLLTEQTQGIEPNELVKLKVRAYNQKASILEGLDQTHDALHQLHLSLECLPDKPGTVYKHTQLLLKLSSEKEAAANWLRFRGIQLQDTKDFSSIKKALRSSIVRLVDNDEVSLDEVQAMDEQILDWCKNTQEDPFIIYTFNRCN